MRDASTERTDVRGAIDSNACYALGVATGQTAWVVATRFPCQGEWTESTFLALPEGYPRVELCDGHLEELPMPTDRHQACLTAMLLALLELAKRVGGWARPAGLRVRLRPGVFREPDVAFLEAASASAKGNEMWTGADLLVEVVSGGPEDRARDYVAKRRDYALAGVREYWIVDPQDELITVLALDGDAYREHGVFRRGERAVSAAYPDLAVEVTAVIDAD